MDYKGPVFRHDNNPGFTDDLVDRMAEEGKLMFDLYTKQEILDIQFTQSDLLSNQAQFDSLGVAQDHRNSKFDFSFVGKDPTTILESDLPKSLNWADIDGESFYPEITRQDCQE